MDEITEHMKAAESLVMLNERTVKRYYPAASRMCLLLAFCVIPLAALDVWQCRSKYLYLSLEWFLSFCALFLYFETFKDDFPFKKLFKEKDLSVSKSVGLFVRASFAVCCSLFLLVWVTTAVISNWPFAYALLRGRWGLFYVAVFSISFLIIRKRLSLVRPRAMMVSLIIMMIVLTAFEYALVMDSKGWAYGDVIIAFAGRIPIDNLIFVYPLAVICCFGFVSAACRFLGGEKGVLILNAILMPASIIVEWVCIYILHLFRIYPENSILPLGQTSFEEILYYVHFQFLATVLYVYFSRRIKERGDDCLKIGW